MDFTLYSDYFIIINCLIILFSLIIDLVIGDPHFKNHPVMLIGNTISWLKSKLRTGKRKQDKILGIVLIFLVMLIFCLPIYLSQIILWWFWNIWIISDWDIPNLINILTFSALMGFVLKWSFAVKNLGDVTLPISEALKQNNLEKARTELSLIVRRETKELEKKHILSATIECIAESSTDAVTSVFWFYLMGNLLGIIIFTYFHIHFMWLFLGIPFAYAFRIINTADSIVGYKDLENINIGWFSARMDDFSNYLPTRLTVIFMLFAGLLMKKKVKNAWKILKLEKNNTESVNAGWTMSTIAGLLNIQLEKIGYYKLGIPIKTLEPYDINTAYKLIQLTIILFILFISTIIFSIIMIILS